MGVHGLTTYLREHQRVLAKTKQFSLARVLDDNNDTITTVVVDGWSFIYEIYDQSRLPWVYGGEYDAFARSVVQVVEAWIAVGLKVYFVFDGASPELKIPTLISRLNRTNVQNSLLFFRTSPASRSTPRFLRENAIIPPLVLLSCIETLGDLTKSHSALEVHFADEEADPYAVELAGRLSAYVIGNDSDFVILNSGRYAGYIPLNEMLWTKPLPIFESPNTHKDQEDGFQTVVSKTKKRSNPMPQQISSGLIPPAGTPLSGLVLSAVVYTPSALATHLKLPTTLLPLLASLVGNDFTNQSSTQRNVQSLFFERSLTLSQRITHAANTLSSILNAATQPRKAKHRVGSVMDLIDRTVNALLVRSPTSLAVGEIDSIVDRIVAAALQYAIDKYEGDVYGPASLWPTPVCALHREDVCPLQNLFSRALSHNQVPGNTNVSSPDGNVLMLRSLYVKAFRGGMLHPKITDVLNSGTFWPRIFLDSPDMENVAISIGKSARVWMYALLDDAVGLAEAPEEETCAVDGSVSEDNGADLEDPDELVDVVEQDSDDDADLLAPLRGELRRLREPKELYGAIPASASSRSRSRPPPRPKCVIEYIRRGARIASERVPVPDLAAFMISSGFEGGVDSDAWVPVQLRNTEERMALLLHILGSNILGVKDIPSDRLFSVLVLRWIVQTLHQRALESGMNKERDQERWTRQEAHTFLACYGSPPSTHVQDGINTADQSRTNATGDASARGAVPLTNRNVQLMAQVLMAIETIHLLTQVLFLTDRVPANVQGLSGEKFHAYLTHSTPIPAEAVPSNVWAACVASLEDAFAPERQTKAKRPRVEQAKSVAKVNTKATPRSQGLFTLLGDDVA